MTMLLMKRPAPAPHLSYIKRALISEKAHGQSMQARQQKIAGESTQADSTHK